MSATMQPGKYRGPTEAEPLVALLQSLRLLRPSYAFLSLTAKRRAAPFDTARRTCGLPFLLIEEIPQRRCNVHNFILRANSSCASSDSNTRIWRPWTGRRKENRL